MDDDDNCFAVNRVSIIEEKLRCLPADSPGRELCRSGQSTSQSVVMTGISIRGSDSVSNHVYSPAIKYSVTVCPKFMYFYFTQLESAHCKASWVT